VAAVPERVLREVLLVLVLGVVVRRLGGRPDLGGDVTEAVRIVFDPIVVSFADLVKTFFEVHDPTQGMRQGNDVGTQYRSAIYYTTPAQEQTARELTKVYADELARRRYGDITTEIRPASETPYYYAEDHHQQYLAKNPFGYRCHANTGIRFPDVD
jgi:peptide-methionine (S)-S-oxide reductase